jgi:hypothetical protein
VIPRQHPLLGRHQDPAVRRHHDPLETTLHIIIIALVPWQHQQGAYLESCSSFDVLAPLVVRLACLHVKRLSRVAYHAETHVGEWISKGPCTC